MGSNSYVVFHSGFGMETAEAHEESESSKLVNDIVLDRNGETISVIPCSPTSKLKSTWKREVVKRDSCPRIRRQRKMRSQSLPACQLNKYSAGEIRRIRERLLRTQRHPEPGPVRHFTRTQKLALTALAVVDFISFCSMSIMAPFFPKEVCHVRRFHLCVFCLTLYCTK